MICYLDQIINEFIGRGGRGGRSSVILPLLDFFVRDAQSDNARMIFGGAGCVVCEDITPLVLGVRMGR